MRRVLGTGALLLALTGAAWSMPSCSDDGPPPVDAGYGTIVDTSLAPDARDPADGGS